ncbi:MAG TPA: TonB-dependent receptor, partial [Polyangia bacterium]|nr:TonB-dependent receptor [Polyangia bacterium]
NTYFITSNINRTEPEQLTVYTLAADFAVLAHLDLRLDWYYQKNDNPIDFSMARPNLATNLVSDSITGIESEILWDAPLSSLDLLSGFVNYTWAHLVDETVIDTTLMKSTVLPWAPQHVFNVGIAYNGHGFGASLQCHYQGRVFRRPSDIYDPDGTVSPTAAYRPMSVAPWATLDARLSYRVTEWLRVGVQGTNITNTKGFYLKTDRYPFDYQIEGARVMGTIEVALKLPFRTH